MVDEKQEPSLGGRLYDDPGVANVIPLFFVILAALGHWRTGEIGYHMRTC